MGLPKMKGGKAGLVQLLLLMKYVNITFIGIVEGELTLGVSC